MDPKLVEILDWFLEEPTVAHEGQTLDQAHNFESHILTYYILPTFFDYDDPIDVDEVRAHLARAAGSGA